MRFDFRVDLTELRDRLEAGRESLQDFSPVFEDLEDQAAEEFRQNFEAEGSLRSWDPLAPATVAKKARLGQPARALEATGGLRRSFTDGGPGSIAEIGPEGARFGSSHPLAAVHHQGDPRTNLPARDLLQVSDEFLDQVGDASARHVEDGFS